MPSHLNHSTNASQILLHCTCSWWQLEDNWDTTQHTHLYTHTISKASSTLFIQNTLTNKKCWNVDFESRKHTHAHAHTHAHTLHALSCTSRLDGFYIHVHMCTQFKWTVRQCRIHTHTQHWRLPYLQVSKACTCTMYITCKQWGV